MSPAFADADFDPLSPAGVLQDAGFFPYSGADGDLYRKHGLPGWRVSVYGRRLIRIQEKTGVYQGRNQWATRRRWETDPDTEDDLPPVDIQAFRMTLTTLLENGTISADQTSGNLQDQRDTLRSRLEALSGLETDHPEFLVWAGDGKEPAIATTHADAYRVVVANQVTFRSFDLDGLLGLAVVYGPPAKQSLDEVTETHPWIAYQHARGHYTVEE